MCFPCYLAMTAAEFAACQALPSKIAWMACHFSCYGTGLTNVPIQLPSGSMILVNDRTPICGHDPAQITQQLQDLVHRLLCDGVLLDFQRPDVPETRDLCRHLAKKLDCPVGVSALYAKELDCPVFLPPLDLLVPPQAQLASWQGREIWLEAAFEHRQITLTPDGAQESPCLRETLPDPRFYDEALYCHHHWTAHDQIAVVTLQRTRQDLDALLSNISDFGVTRAVGLYQELGI